MDYKTLVENLVFWSKAFHVNPQARDALEKAANAITELLARAEAAEVRCETLEKMVREYQDEIVPGYRERAEKAERERDDAVETIFKWTGCAECKHWKSDTDWCEKHDRYATMSDGCTTPEWRGIKED